MRPVRTTLSSVNLSKRGVPKKFHNLNIEDDFDDYGSESLAEVKEFIINYMNNLDDKFDNNEGLFLFGSNGVGKSYLASFIVKEAYRRRYTSKRTTFAEYITEYTRVWNARNKAEREELESMFYHEYKAVEFLVLEEVGKEIDTKIAIPILEDCLRYREEKGLPTITCTNLDPKIIKEKYGNSIASLMKGNQTPVKIVGVDKRKEYYSGGQK